MLILIDGYNVIAPVAPPGRGSSEHWLRNERNRLIDHLSHCLGSELAHETTIVFDAANSPTGVDSRFIHQGIEIEFAIGYPEADDRIEELIAAHSSPKRLTVVSSDHRIQNSARRRGALAVDSNIWLDRLTDGHVMLAIPQPGSLAKLEVTGEEEKPLDADQVAHWLAEFGMVEDTPNENSTKKSSGIKSPFPPGYGEDLL